MNKLRNPLYLLFMLVMVGGAAYILYAWMTYSGLFRWTAEWEMAQFGSYDVEGTFIGLLFLVVGVPALVLARIEKATKARRGSATAAPPRPAAPRQIPARALAFIGLAAILVAAGAAWLGYQKSQQPVAFEAVNLGDHRAPQTTHVEITGVAQTGMIVEFEETINGNKRVSKYLPLTPPDWQEGQPITYFLKPNIDAYGGPNGYETLDPNTPPFQLTQKGVLFSNDLPGAVEAEYEKHGLKLASPSYVLDANESADIEIYWEVAAGAGITALVLLLSAAIMPIAARRAKARGR